MSSKVSIWLVRHGESESNAGLATRDAVTIPLTTTGHDQAALVAGHFQSAPRKIVVSHYTRAQQTAAPLIERFSQACVEQWPVHEFTYLPEEYYRGKTNADRKDHEDQYWERARPHECLGPGAESFAQFIDRLATVRARLLAESRGPVIIVSHRRFLAGLIWLTLTNRAKVSTRGMIRYRQFDRGLGIKNGAIFHTQWEAGQPLVGPMQTDHLHALPRTSSQR
ncbi:MAG: histidine phosphatase family protein [Planctomycetales bacterium]|nr:histidine phosphatase family protein [Planctomycetales bacterium]